MSPEELRSWRKERGLQPVRPWHEKPFAPLTLAEVIDEYVPPEGDGKLSPLNSAVRSIIQIHRLDRYAFIFFIQVKFDNKTWLSTYDLCHIGTNGGAL